jgi:hypothetical protein
MKNVFENAKNNNLTVVELKSGNKAIVDFQDFESCEKFAAENEGEINLFFQKAGESLFEKKGLVFKPLTAQQYVEDLGYEYFICGGIQEETDNFEEIMAEIDDEILKKECKNEFLKLIEEIEKTPADKVAIRYNFKYLESIEKEMMSYSVGSKFWIIGVFI